MTDPSQPLAGLSPAEKRMLLAQLLRDKASQARSLFPLAHGQRGLWFLYQMDRAGSAYNVRRAVRIRSPLDVAAFRRALQALVDRHPSLRTTFAEHGGELRQRVHEKATVAFEVTDAAA
jgi:hypothetical protein